MNGTAEKVWFVANPAAIAAEWVSDSGTTWQLMVIRGGQSVYFGTAGSITPAVNPERFGPVPTDRKSMLAYAERFLAS